MKPGYLVYEHRILVDLDDAEMVRLAEKEIQRSIDLDVEHNEIVSSINEIELTMKEALSFDNLGKRIAATKKMLAGLNDDGEDED